MSPELGPRTGIAEYAGLRAEQPAKPLLRISVISFPYRSLALPQSEVSARGREDTVTLLSLVPLARHENGGRLVSPQPSVLSHSATYFLFLSFPN